MTVAPHSNRLAVLAVDIRNAHADVTRGTQTVAERALAAGDMLIEAKAALPHGEWAGWLTQHTGLSGRTARLYMQLARSGMKTATVADLGLQGAVSALAAESKRRRLLSPVPPPGHYTYAQSIGEDQVIVWPVEDARFHILHVSGICGNNMTTSRRSVPSIGVEPSIALLGFPPGQVFVPHNLTEAARAEIQELRAFCLEEGISLGTSNPIEQAFLDHMKAKAAVAGGAQ